MNCAHQLVLMLVQQDEKDITLGNYQRLLSTQTCLLIAALLLKLHLLQC